MKVLLLKIFIISILCFIFLCVCDAPRHNPLDPSNPNNKLAQLSGSVFTRNAPPAPVADVTVLWQPAGRIIQTNSAGKFSFNDLLSAEGWLIANKNGFSVDSVYINLLEKEHKSHEFYLNSEPVLLFANMSSKVMNKYSADPNTKLYITISVSDIDNDIDSVLISNDLLGIQKILDYNVGTRQYENNYSPYLLGVKSLEQIVGQNFEIIVKDVTGASFSVGSTQLVRIIHDEIQFNSPANGQQVNGPLELAWNLFEPGFDFTFDVEIYTDELFNQELVWEQLKISSDLNSISIEPELPAGNYFWVIWCVDEYGNRSRSKLATFTITGN